MGKLTISEVQITCILIMGLITMFLVFSERHKRGVQQIYMTSRRLLACGTFLIALHFIIQYHVQKTYTATDVYQLRTNVNLLFGIPISYFFYISYLYLQRDGKIKRMEWRLAPILFILSTAVNATYFTQFIPRLTFDISSSIAAVLYAFMMMIYASILVKEQLHIRKEIKRHPLSEKRNLLNSTQKSLFIMVVIALGFPIMTFNANLMMRSLYGLLSISAAFIYCLSFISYGNTTCTVTKAESASIPQAVIGDNNLVEKEEDKTSKKHTRFSQLYMLDASEKFIAEEVYLSAGLTLQEAAKYMGVSVHLLREWLQTTRFKKYNNWINYLRIERAKELIGENPRTNTIEIAEKCGYCDRQYFTTQFKKWTGKTPYEWSKKAMSTEDKQGKEEAVADKIDTETKNEP